MSVTAEQPRARASAWPRDGAAMRMSWNGPARDAGRRATARYRERGGPLGRYGRRSPDGEPGSLRGRPRDGAAKSRAGAAAGRAGNASMESPGPWLRSVPNWGASLRRPGSCARGAGISCSTPVRSGASDRYAGA